MTTDDLIEQLGQDLQPVARRAIERRLALGIMLGIFGSVGLIVATLGIRPDLPEAMSGTSFWMKWAYTTSIALAAAALTFRLARPDAAKFGHWWFALPILLLALIGISELAATPRSQWLAMWIGGTATKCPFLVLGLSIPILACLLWSMRRFAPTHLAAAGAAAGLTAGAFAATVYCLHCTESSAIFVLTWYSLGILMAAVFGALIGPRFLRW